MAEEKFLTVREAAALLGVSEKEVVALAENGTLPAYKIGGVFLRFKKEQVVLHLRRMQPAGFKPAAAEKGGFQDRLRDFFYFNDFYIASLLVIIFLLALIFRGD
jgi:excisionase family DNA binding protein